MESSDIVKELFSEMAQYLTTLTTANSSQQSEDSYADTLPWLKDFPCYDI